MVSVLLSRRDSEAGNSESFQVVLCQELCPKVSQHQLKLMRLIIGVEPRSIGGNLKEVLYQRGWRGLWQGNGVNAFCTAPLQAIELLTFEAVKRCLTSARNRWAAAEDSPQINLLGCQLVSVPMAWISPSMVAGAVAGVVSTVSCYPVKVLKLWIFTYRRKNV
ncbi:unnamed protein product [Sphagnum troendelagicum]|uniref:Uncharacterized protein n=1 Tax=Sphagnum jensenii TaxID=128206 RepID=A0ABP0WM41_9BRYO